MTRQIFIACHYAHVLVPHKLSLKVDGRVFGEAQRITALEGHDGMLLGLQAFSRARCVGTKFGDTIWATAGLHMRYWFSYVEWGSMDDMDVRCTEKDLNPGGGFLAFATMLDKMRSTKFCPAFSGDAQSSRRLSEIFLTGCIPVFLGPPYHTMPSPDQVRALIFG